MAAEDRFATLIEAIAARRDETAFAELFRHFAPRLKSYCMRGGAGAEAAEEVAQETMIAVWRRAETFDPDRASATTWIFTIARNRRIDMIRRERRPEPEPVEARDDADPAPGPAERLETEQARRQVRANLAALSDEQAAVLRMSFLDDKPHGRIAEELGLPLGTVKSRIRLGLARMRTMAEGLAPC